MLPLLALVGRPNVGKSTLFNRIVGQRLAIVEDRPGVTRDRQYHEADHDGRQFRAVDTGGFTTTTTEKLVAAVRTQALFAINEADVIILVVDARAGLTSADADLADVLRKGGKPVLLAANKIDSFKRESEVDLGELYKLGMDVFPVSAEHGRGVADLLDAAMARLPKLSKEERAAEIEAISSDDFTPRSQRANSRAVKALAAKAEDEKKEAAEAGEDELDEDGLDTDDLDPNDLGDGDGDGVEDGEGDDAPSSFRDAGLKKGGPVKLSVIGRPNVGKSTLLNRLIGSERFVASEMPGTTRDAVDETILHKGREFILTDTAGLRKKRNVVDKVEVFSAQRALRAVEEADVVLVLSDVSELGVEQDSRIAAQAEERGRAIILCVNKWDLVKDKEAEGVRLREEAERHLQHVGFAPMIFISALEGTRVNTILDLAADLHDEAATRIPTPALNAWVQEMQDSHPAPLWNGFPVRMSYAYQVAMQPITIAIQCNRPQVVSEVYRRFLLRGLRERFNLRVPVRLLFKQKSRASPRGIGGPRGRVRPDNGGRG
jgi:GTP-binding protein